MSSFPESELILTPEKRLYHIDLKGDDIADDVIIVGDQNRVARISRHFSKIEFSTSRREFVTHTGICNGKRITVLSTGIGTDNIDIVLNELDAAVNIDPVRRELNSKHRSLNIIRLGTSGSLQADIPVNAMVTSSYGLGLDGLLNFYAEGRSINEDRISEEFIKHVSWLPELPFPYCISASEDLLHKFKNNTFVGITATAPGFYGPQGRQLRLKAAMPDLNEQLATFKLQGLRITNFEMETSALYGLGKLLGHHCLTVCVIIANRVRKEFSENHERSVDLLIESCLDKLLR